MAMGGGGSTYKSADGIWHAAIDIEPDRATGRRRRLTTQGKTKAVANARLRMKLDAYVRKGFTPNSPSPRLMDWLETWYHERAEANLRPNSRRSYENAIARLNKIAGAEAHRLAGPQGYGRHSGRPEVLQPEDGHDHLVRPEERA